MKGNPQVIQVLNELLTCELTSVNQYFLAAKITLHKGYLRLGKMIYKESIDEMRHADKLIDRILFLEGLPNLQKLDKIHTGETVPEQLRLDLENEVRIVVKLNDAVKLCRDINDNGSADLLEEILREAEEHVDFLESQCELLRELGDVNYLAQQLRPET